MLSATTIVCALLIVGLFLWSQRRFYLLAWKVGGPPAWPLLGNVAFFLDSANFVKNGFELCNKFPKWYRLWVGPHLVVFLNKPELVEVVLKSPQALDKGPMYRAFSIVIGGDGLFNSSGAAWQSHRKFLNPTMQHFSLLNSFHPSFNRHLRALVGQMHGRVGDGEIDIFKVIERTTLDILCETTFGTLRKEDEQANAYLFRTVSEGMSIAGKFFTKPWYHIKPIFWMTKDYKVLDKARSFGYEYVSKIIHHKTMDYQNHSTTAPSNDGEQGKKVLHNFINECLRLSIDTKLFSHDDLIHESITMLLAGFETTAVSVSYVLLMLAMHPDCQERVFEELRSLLPDQNSDVTSAELNQLQYTNQVIKETLRLNPAVPYMTRRSKADLTLDNVVFPAGTEIAIPVIHVQRNPAVWGPNANAFNPDNFLPENIGSKHKYAYMAFSAGQRNCIGNKYGNMSMRMFVCWLVRNFRFSTKMRMEDMEYGMCITLKLLNGHMMEIHRRETY